MAAIEWLEVEGFRFSDSEAREASDFGEILDNHDLEPDRAFEMFRCEDLPVGRRLWFAAKVSDDNLAFMFLREADVRLCGLVKRRLENARRERNGGIIC
jgi:hypothetical protein